MKKCQPTSIDLDVFAWTLWFLFGLLALWMIKTKEWDLIKNLNTDKARYSTASESRESKVAGYELHKGPGLSGI